MLILNPEGHVHPYACAKSHQGPACPCISINDEGHTCPCISANNEGHACLCISDNDEGHACPCISANNAGTFAHVLVTTMRARLPMY